MGDNNPISSNVDEGVFEESFFRIIPDKPNAGGTIRVTGDNFGSSQQFEFFINTKKIGLFDTDSNGHFMTTFQIPLFLISMIVLFSNAILFTIISSTAYALIGIDIIDKANIKIKERKIPLTEDSFMNTIFLISQLNLKHIFSF